MTNGSDDAVLETNYEFFPSVRQGYRPSRSYDGSGDPLTGRSRLDVSLTVEGEPADGGGWEEAENDPSVDLRMYGPGDVSGIDRQQVVRVEPEPNTSTFPPNYFPIVEFDRPDLPWLFSPERARTDDWKVRPWMTLVVLERGRDDITFESEGTKPLPAVTVPTGELPPVQECWAWAHVQVVGELSPGELERVFTKSSLQAVSRLVCPRNLQENTPYTAAVVPTFEPSVRAGLGKDPYDAGEGETPEIRVAWERSADESVTLPIYYQWSFTTGDKGDFESLARKLEPTRMDRHDVGVRELDLSEPGPKTLAVDDGITRTLGGALQSPGLEPSAYPDGKRGALRDLLNNPGEQPGVEESDVPVVGPPIYGQWYLPEDAGWELGETGRPEPPGLPASSGTRGLAKYFGSWVHELNVDPQFRIPASYGTEVVQENQEQLMEAAWQQFGDLELANERMASSQAGHVVGENLSERASGVDADRFGSRVRDPVGFADDLETYRDLQRAGAIPADSLTEDLLEGQSPPEVVGGADFGGDIDTVAGGDTGTVAGGEIVDWEGTGETGDGGTVDPATMDDGTVTRTGVASDRRLTSSVGGAMQGFQQRTVTQDRMGVAETLPGDAVTDGAGVLAMAETAAQTARLAEVNSPSFRRLTRQGGKLAKGVQTASQGTDLVGERASETFTFDTEQAIGSRYGGTEMEFGGSGEGGQSAVRTGEGETGPAQTGPAQTDAEADRTDWRVDDAGNTLTLEAAVERLDGPAVTVPQTLLAVESVREHCATARDRLSELEAHLTAIERDEQGALDRVVASLTERPTVGDNCRAIGENTADALARQTGKLVAADPEPLDPAFTEETRAAVLEQFEAATEQLVTAVASAESAIQREQFDPAAVKDEVTAAQRALDDVEAAVGTVEGHLDSGVPPGTGRMQPMSGGMQAMSAEAPADVQPGTGPAEITSQEPELPQTDLNAMLWEGYGGVPGMLDAGGWSKQAAAWRINPGLLERDVELAPILAAPEFDQPMYKWLKRVDQQYLLPGAEKVPKNAIGAVETDSAFIESFMAGLNHEMGRELLWRKFPTDRRGTYFRQFWEYIGEDDQPDIRKLHRWGTSPLGENRSPGISSNRVVLLIRGELLDAYPNTRIYAVKAVREDRTDTSDERVWDRMPLLEKKRKEAIAERKNDTRDTLPDYDQDQLERWEPKEPIFRGKLDPDITFLGFELTTEEAEGETLEETGDEDGETDSEEDYGWFFVLEEPLGETRFGLDVPTEGDHGSIPCGIKHGPADNRTKATQDNCEEYGWNGLSWGHLVDDPGALDGKRYVSVTGDNPSGGDGDAPWAIRAGDNRGDGEAFDAADAAEWGKNSAHMAQITWQLPVRICIHGDDLLPDVSDEDQEQATIADNFVLATRSDRANGGGN